MRELKDTAVRFAVNLIDQSNKKQFLFCFVALAKTCKKSIGGFGGEDSYKISDLSEVPPNGYILRFPFYIMGTRDAHIQIQPSTNRSVDGGYEIGK